MVTRVTDPLEGAEFSLRTDKKYLATGGVERPTQIPTLLFPDIMTNSWQVIPLLELSSSQKPNSIYRLFGNFDRSNYYQLGDGLKLQYQANTVAWDGVTEQPARVVRSVAGGEESEVKVIIERLLSVDLR